MGKARPGVFQTKLELLIDVAVVANLLRAGCKM